MFGHLSTLPSAQRRIVQAVAAAVAVLSYSESAFAAQTALADQPARTTVNVPANIVMPLSVEYPTAVSVGYPIKGNAFSAGRYDGYFDPNKCYDYVSNAATSVVVDGAAAANYSVFVPKSVNTNYTCNGKWSGSFLNWATMQTIDLFRWAMTGGTRIVDRPINSSDTSSPMTVLRRAWQSGQGGVSNFPDRTLPAALVSSYTPFAGGSDLTVSNSGRGDQFAVWGGGLGSGQTYNAWVQVCVPTLLESNCTDYSTSSATILRPEGVVQQNRSNMLFSVFSYLYNGAVAGNNGTNQPFGGIMRARARHLIKTGETALPTNLPRAGVAAPPEIAEISDTGAIIANPESGMNDMKNSAGDDLTKITNSGVINYINQFGYTAHNYMTYDAVSLLYAEALKYLKGETRTIDSTYIPSSPASVSSSRLDGFPAIVDWPDSTGSGASLKVRDPILRWCQKNFLVGIGDVNTHHDRHLNGGDATIPSTVDMDAEANAYTLTDKVGTLESMPGSNLGSQTDIKGDGTGYDIYNNGSISPSGCCSGDNSFFISGLAYYANNMDIRLNRPVGQPSGKIVTAQTYWVDVLEFQVYKHRNQYWLAAKYGYVDTAGKRVATDSTTDWKNPTPFFGFTLPRNYYPAYNASAMATGLVQAFAQIKQAIAEGSGVGASSPTVTLGASGTDLFSVKYDSTTWGGQVIGETITSIDSSTGVAATSTYFNTDTTLDFTGTKWKADNRKVVTMTTVKDAFGVVTGTQAVPFEWTNLSTEQKTALNNDQNVLSYLRGDKSKESPAGSFRVRARPLGDIVNAEAVYLGKPVSPYDDYYNPGYSSFASSYKNRLPVLFVGANDGMMHVLAPNDYTDSGNSLSISKGTELWAYVPSFLFNGPTLPATPAVDGLLALSSSTYQHHYYVDTTPVIADVDFNNTKGKSNTSSQDWRTILVGGLGKGGKGFYALDVTYAAKSASTEVNVTSKVLWEFTDTEMGYSYGQPVIVKTAKYGWVVMLTSGYNNSTGKGVLYIVNPVDGSLIQKIYTSADTSGEPSGLTQATAFVPDYTNFTATALYAGDLLGNVWRFDLTGDTVPAPVQFATLTAPDSTVQPVTTPPQTEYEAASLKRWIFVGTGRMLHPNDTTNSASLQTQTFYAIRDGYRKAPNASTDLPASIGSFPIKRTHLTPATTSDLISATGVVVSTDHPMGWYFDLPGINSDNTARERVVIMPKAVAGRDIIAWAGLVPSADPCSPTGTGYLYVTSFANAKSFLTDSTGTSVASKTISEVVDIRVVLDSANSVNAINITDSSGGVTVVGFGKPTGLKPHAANWRLMGQ